MSILFRRFIQEELGATSIEYAMISAVVAVAAIAGLVAFANSNNGLYDKLTTAVLSTNGGGS